MNWLKQTPDKPLFDDLLWSRPENKRFAGKLLIAGGHAHAVTVPGMVYSAAQDAGIGITRVILPDSTQKIVGKIFPEAEFVPSTPSGSFSRQSLAPMLEAAGWADGVLLAGDFGKNSETAILLESFADKYKGLVCLADDAVDYFISKNSNIVSRGDTLVVAEFVRIQKLAQLTRPSLALKNFMSLHNLVEALAEWTKEAPLQITTLHSEQFIVAAAGEVSTTPVRKTKNWQIELPAYVIAWLIQQPAKSFKALTTAVFDYLNHHGSLQNKR